MKTMNLNYHQQEEQQEIIKNAFSVALRQSKILTATKMKPPSRRCHLVTSHKQKYKITNDCNVNINANYNKIEYKTNHLRLISLKSIYFKKFNFDYFSLDEYNHNIQNQNKKLNDRCLFYLFNLYLWLIILFTLIKLLLPTLTHILYTIAIVFLVIIFVLVVKHAANNSLRDTKTKISYRLRNVYKCKKRRRLIRYLFIYKNKTFSCNNIFYLINYAYFSKFLNSLNNCIEFTLFVKNYLILNCLILVNLVKINLIKLKYNSILNQKQEKTLFMIVFMLPSFCTNVNATKQASTSSTNTQPGDSGNENDDVSWSIRYDEALFNELNMDNTIQGVYRSCFKERYEEIRDHKHFNSDFSYNKVKSGTIYSNYIQKTSKEILLILLNRERTILSVDLLNKIDRVCSDSESNNNKNLDVLEKLILLYEYEHELCGNIFRNSIKKSHLNNDVLKLANSGDKAKRNLDDIVFERATSEPQDEEQLELEDDVKIVGNDTLVKNIANTSFVDSYFFSFNSSYRVNSRNKRFIHYQTTKYPMRYSSFKYSTMVRLQLNNSSSSSLTHSQSYFRPKTKLRYFKASTISLFSAGGKRNTSTKQDQQPQATLTNRVVYNLTSNKNGNSSFGLNLKNTSSVKTSDNNNSSSRQDVEMLSSSSTSTPKSIKHNLSNCTLILLNIYLSAFKSNCDYSDFAESLAHYDCASNNFSVRSDCTKCSVSSFSFEIKNNVVLFENKFLLFLNL